MLAELFSEGGRKPCVIIVTSENLFSIRRLASTRSTSVAGASLDSRYSSCKGRLKFRTSFRRRSFGFNLDNMLFMRIFHVKNNQDSVVVDLSGKRLDCQTILLKSALICASLLANASDRLMLTCHQIVLRC